MRGLRRTGDGFSIDVDRLEDIIRSLENMGKLARTAHQDRVGIGSKIILSNSDSLEMGKVLSFTKKGVIDYPENTPLPVFVKNGEGYRLGGEGEITHVGHSRENTFCIYKLVKVYEVTR